MKHAMPYVKFIISSTELSAYRLKSVSIFDRDEKTPLSGNFSANIENGEIENVDGRPYATVSIATPQILTTPQEVYLTTLPTNLTSKEIYIVVTLVNDDMATVTIPILKEGKELRSNALNVIEIKDLKISDNSCDWYEPVETRLLVGGWAYGESNCIMTPVSSAGVNNTVSVKARGNFMEVEEPKYAMTIFNNDLNNDHKMVGVNGSPTAMSSVLNDYTITVNAYSVAGGYPGGCGQVAIYGEDQTTILSRTV